MLFALGGDIASRSLSESGAAESSEQPLFNQIFTRMFNELESNTAETTEVTELTELLTPQTLELLREKLTEPSSGKTENSNELLNKLFESEDSEESLEQLTQIIPAETLSQFESTEQLISKLDNLQTTSPEAEDIINKLKDFLGSNRQKVNEFLKSLESTSLSEGKSATRNTPAEVGLISDKSINDKTSKHGQALKLADSNPQSTAKTNPKPSYEFVSKKPQDNFEPQTQSKNSIKQPVISQKGSELKQPISENSGKNPLDMNSVKSKVVTAAQNTENNTSTNKSLSEQISIKDIKQTVKQTVKNSADKFDFTDIQASQIRQAPQLQKAQPSMAKQIDFTGREADISRQVQESIQTAAKEGAKQVKVNLNPPELGKIVINLKHQSGKLTGKLEVENPQTKIEIDKAISSVVENLRNSGLTIRKPEVVLTDNDSNSNHQQGFRGGEFADSRFASQQESFSGRKFGSQDSAQATPNPKTGLSSPESTTTESAGNKAGIDTAGLDFLV